MEGLKMIALLCQISCTSNLQEAQNMQRTCHAFYAECTAEEHARYIGESEESNIKTCMIRRERGPAPAPRRPANASTDVRMPEPKKPGTARAEY